LKTLIEIIATSLQNFTCLTTKLLVVVEGSHVNLEFHQEKSKVEELMFF